MVKEKDLEILERALKEALERVEKMKKEIAPETVTKVKMIDGLTGNVIHIAKIKEESPTDERIEKCKKNMIGNRLGSYVYRTMIDTENRELLETPGWDKVREAIVKEREAKVREALKWEVYQDVE
jgi:hypothetical protein